MESGGEQQQKHYELRSRSRSRSETPQILSRTVTENEGSEHHYELRSRSRDRSMTPGEVTSSRRSASRSLPSSVVKARNKNMDPIVEKDDTLTDNNSDTQSKSSEKSATVTKSTKKVERRSERQRIKRQIFVNGQSETKDDSDTKSENKESKRESLTPKRMMTSDYSSEEGDREDGPSRPGSAYEFYKQQGEYWNKFPKTDYTYSQASQCRYEVAPGVMAMPNMSRRSLHSDSPLSGQASNSQSLSQSSKESFANEGDNGAPAMDANEMRRDLSDMVPQVLPHIRGSGTAGQSVIYKRTHVEKYSTRREYVYDSANDNQINEKYESWANPLLKSHSANRYRSAANVDSDTELDDAVNVSNHKYHLKDTQRFGRFASLVSTWFYATLHFVTFGQFRKREFSTSHYYRRYEETKWSRFRRQIDTFMQHMYLSLVKVVLLDSWILSRASNIRERAQGRRTKIIWLVLLPLVLTIGAYLAHKHTLTCLNYLRNVRESVADTSASVVNLTLLDYELFYKYLSTLKNVSLPSLPTLNVSLPTLPSLGWD